MIDGACIKHLPLEQQSNYDIWSISVLPFISVKNQDAICSVLLPIISLFCAVTVTANASTTIGADTTSAVTDMYKLQTKNSIIVFVWDQALRVVRLLIESIEMMLEKREP